MTKQYLIDFENNIRISWRTGRIKCPHHFCGGNEDQLIEYFDKFVNKNDWVFSTHRNAYHWLLKTRDPEWLRKQIEEKNNSMHIIDIRRKFISTAIVGGNVGPAVGTAKAIKIMGSLERVHCFVGDAACDQGWFFEALRYAGNNDLPITFIIEDNNRSVETTFEQRWGCPGGLADWVRYGHLVYYRYVPTYPHVGDGKPIEW